MTESENKNQQTAPEKKQPETTGHEWDGISEYNIPAPRWWLIVWLITIIWSFGYWIFYPTWPVPGGNTKGTLGWSEQSQLQEAQGEIDVIKKVYLDKLSDGNFEQIQKDPKLMEFVLNGGRAAFKENCAACHGTGAAGSKGFPNLNDDDWLWGGKVEDIYQTIKYGIRSSHEKTRTSQMPAFGLDKVLKKDEVEMVARYVMSLSDRTANNASDRTANNASDKAASKNPRGAVIFKNNCAVCHGSQGKGGREFGAPNLSDAIWLYGGDKENVELTVTYAHAGVMPYWIDRLDDNTIKELAIYVHSLGGGE